MARRMWLEIEMASGHALDELARREGDLPRCPGESDDSVRDRLLMLLGVGRPASEPDEDAPSCHEVGSGRVFGSGVDLRDVFAAAALQGLLATKANDSPRSNAERAYLLADAMLVARQPAEERKAA